MIEQIKELIKEQENIEKEKERVIARINKLNERLSGIEAGHYIIDGELWQIEVRPNYVIGGGERTLKFRGEVFQESDDEP